MTHTIVNPAGLHDPVPFGYGHTAAVPAGSDLVVVAGQYGSGPDGAVVAPAFAAQVRQAFANLGVALAAHGLDLRHVVQLRTYVVGLDADKLATVGRIVGELAAAGGTGGTGGGGGEGDGDGAALPPPQTLVGVAALATPEILFEVEAVAARPVAEP
ncbi:MAG TPA: Rid family hydrolase [Acidimicrobiales bacterium]